MADATQPLPRGIYEKDPGSEIYWIRFTDFEGRLRREKAGRLSNAKKLLTVRRNEKLNGKVPALPLKADPAVKVLTVGNLIDTAKDSTKSHRSCYDLHRKFEHIRVGAKGGKGQKDVEGLGALEASKVVKSDLVQWLDEMTKSHEWANASRNRYQAAISLIFRIAVEDKKLHTNPATGIKHLQENNSRARYLSLEEERALMKELREQRPTYAPIVVLAMHTGPRVSELFRVKVGDYSPETGKLAIRQTKYRGSTTLRYVPLTPMAVEAYKALAQGKKVGEPLCTQPDKEQTAVKETKYWFEPCRDAAKLVDFHFHDLRHTAASRWVMNGVPLAVVARYLGHANV